MSYQIEPDHEEETGSERGRKKKHDGNSVASDGGPPPVAVAGFDGSTILSDFSQQMTMSDPELRDCVYNVVHIGLGDMTCPLPYLCCTLLACEVGLAGTKGNYSSTISRLVSD
jgi:hypothetical protein